MTDLDFPAFDRGFKRLAGVLHLRLTGAALEALVRNYFQILEARSLTDVLKAGDACATKCRVFPKPVDWLDALPKAPTEPRPGAVPIGAMTTSEAAEYVRAEWLRYDDEPCKCLDCRAAGVDHRLLRFVPDFDRDDREVRMKIGDRIVTRGHWAHGEELAAYYRSRDAFWDLCQARSYRTPPRRRNRDPRSFEDRILDLFAKRPKPGKSDEGDAIP